MINIFKLQYYPENHVLLSKATLILSGHYFGMWQWVAQRINFLSTALASWVNARKDALCPPFVAGLMKVIYFLFSFYILVLVTFLHV